MIVPLDTYLAILRTQLETGLWPREDRVAQQLTQFAHRILTQLLIQQRTLPALKSKALARHAALLDSLIDALGDDPEDRALAGLLTRHLREVPDLAQASSALQSVARRLQARGDAAASALLREIVATEFELQAALHEAARSAEMNPSDDAASTEALTPQQQRNLRDYLRGRSASDGELEITGIRAIPGGFSKSTIFLDLEHVATLPSTVVLRADRTDSPVGTTVLNEFKLIQTMYEAGVPVPKPFIVESDPEILGGSFLIVEKIEGGNIGDALDIACPSREFGLDLARSIAKLHQVSPTLLGDALPGSKISTRERMLADIEEFDAKWRVLGQPSVAMELAFGWLRRHIDRAEGDRTIIHRDIGCHNMLVKDDRLAALLDWETAAIGNPAQDLAYVYHTAIQLMPWEEFLCAYREAGGVIPSSHSINYYRVWRAVWLMTFKMMVLSFVASGSADGLGLAYASQYLYQRVNHDLHELLHQVLTESV